QKKRLEERRDEQEREREKLGKVLQPPAADQLKQARDALSVAQNALTQAQQELASSRDGWERPDEKTILAEVDAELRTDSAAAKLREEIDRLNKYIEEYARTSKLGKNDPDLKQPLDDLARAEGKLAALRKERLPRVKERLERQAKAAYETALAPVKARVSDR